MLGHTPQSKHGVQRQSSCSYPVSASCQSFQSQSLSSPESRWSQGSTSSSSRSRVVYQSRSTPTSTQAWVHREKEKCSDHPSKRPPSSHTRRITAPTRRSPLDSSPSMSEGCPSWYRYPMARPSDRSELIACFKRRSRWSMVSGELIAAHWKGVCGFGTNPPIDTVHRMSLDPVAARPARITSCASRAICTTSSSVSVGNPHMK